MAQAFIAYLDADRPDRFVGKLNDYWGDTLVASVTPELVMRAAKAIYPKATGATRNRQAIAPTIAAINYCAELGWCSPIKAKRFRVDAKTKTPADLEWVNAFAEQATEEDLVHLAALCLFMFGTGARVGEATALVWADVDLLKNTAEIRQTKTGHTREAHLPPPIVAALANIPSNRNLEELVFGYAGRGSVSKVWNNVAARAGIAALTPHCCRHGFATTMMRKGIDVKTIAKAGGWKDAATVLRTYAHALDDMTVTDAVFDTPVTQGRSSSIATNGKERKNTA
tara:strand:- start:3644 stop:4492 length:849 start_codon:yes stop_codon:yes gene_type:complete